MTFFPVEQFFVLSNAFLEFALELLLIAFAAGLLAYTGREAMSGWRQKASARRREKRAREAIAPVHRLPFSPTSSTRSAS